MILNLLFLFYLGNAQDSQCILLKDSKSCTDLTGYAIMPSSEFKDLAAFDAFMENTKFDSQSIISSFMTTYQCANFNGRQGRYPLSALCSFMVTTSFEKCKSQMDANVKPLTLCSSTCTGHNDSIGNILKNTTVCDPNPSPEAAKARQDATAITAETNLNSYCASLKSNTVANDAKQCFAGVKAEFAQCGFAKKEESDEYCKVSKEDPCCVAAAGPSMALLAPASNTWIIFAIIAGALSLVGIVFLVFQRVSKSRQRPTTAYQPNRVTQTKSTMFFNNGSGGAAPPVPNTFNNKPRSSLFTTVRASTIFKGKSDTLPRNDKFQQLEDPKGEGNGYEVQIVEDYDAGMDDEMDCRVGDRVIVYEEYDDGWGSGKNVTTGQDGILPLAICEPVSNGTPSQVSRPRSTFSARSQSLLPPLRF
ncbi:hypothetical protein BC833DRAFT_585116 [Globomyces pollinis-pini]|nr:hypothetical protein BC833DRAFT_585116 [Globomyces pollinis-pini]